MSRVKTGIEELDMVLNGGLIEGSTTLVCGGSGTGKTILAANFLVGGARGEGENGLLITMEEGRDHLISNLPPALRRDMNALQERLWVLDLSELRRLSPLAEEKEGISSVLDVEILIEIIQAWAREKRVKRVAIDGIAALGLRYGCENEYRSALFRLVSMMKDLCITSVITTEVNEEGRLSRYGVEEYVADTILVLYYRLGGRILKVYKMRGSSYLHGRHTFEIDDRGIKLYPRLPPPATVVSRDERVKVGVKGLDPMISGGLLAGDAVLVTGSAGTGKTIFGLQFISQGAGNGEKGLIIGFEEPPSVLRRNAAGIGLDIAALEKKGLVEIMHTTPYHLSANKHLAEVRERLKGVSRVMVDSVSDYEIAIPEEELKTFLSTLISEFKARGITSVLTAETPELMGASAITDKGTSYIVDTIIMMRFVEIGSEMKKALNVLKMRGSRHVTEIREYGITSSGLVIGRKFEGVEGVFTGSPRKSIAEKVERFFK
ncbi:MAG: ATPase domain-containing protein [Candidatus Thermoplasmatota archaeon]